jgi:hypothetical protein
MTIHRPRPTNAGGAQVVEQRPAACWATVIDGDAAGHRTRDQERSPFNPIRMMSCAAGSNPGILR